MNIGLVILMLAQDGLVVTKEGKQISGQVEKLTINTYSLGDITLDGKNIYTVYMLKRNPFTKEEVADLVKTLVDKDKKVQEAAIKKLAILGSRIVPFLVEHEKSADEKVKPIINSVIKKIWSDSRVDIVYGKGCELYGTIKSLKLGKSEIDCSDVKFLSITNQAEKLQDKAFSFIDGCKIVGQIKNKKLMIECDGSERNIDTEKILSISKGEHGYFIQVPSLTFCGKIKGDIEIMTSVKDICVNTSVLSSYRQTFFKPFHFPTEWRGYLTNTKTYEGKSFNVTLELDGDKVTGKFWGEDLKEKIWEFKGSLDGNMIEGDIDVGDYFKDAGLENVKCKLKAKFNHFGGGLHRIIGKIGVFEGSQSKSTVEFGLSFDYVFID